jgi:hypothetical protein
LRDVLKSNDKVIPAARIAKEASVVPKDQPVVSICVLQTPTKAAIAKSKRSRETIARMTLQAAHSQEEPHIEGRGKDMKASYSSLNQKQ